MALRSSRVRLLVPIVVAISVLASACAGGGVLNKDYEYEEELYLYLDGSATLNVNASVAALVALRGGAFDVDPQARIDRAAVEAFFAGPGAAPRVTLSRRDGRRFVHVRVDVDDVTHLSRRPPFSWSSYAFGRKGDIFEFRQVVGSAVGKPVGDVGWTGGELVAFRAHLPSEIPFHNSPDTIRRGNILEWEQPLNERLKGTELDLQVHLETESILYTTLLLFGSTIVAAALAFGLVLWWVMRRGKHAQIAESSS